MSTKETTIPGRKAKHRWITDTCRANKGDGGALDEALASLRKEYEAMREAHGEDHPGVKYHVALTVEYPQD